MARPRTCAGISMHSIAHVRAYKQTHPLLRGCTRANTREQASAGVPVTRINRRAAEILLARVRTNVGLYSHSVSWSPQTSNGTFRALAVLTRDLSKSAICRNYERHSIWILGLVSHLSWIYSLSVSLRQHFSSFPQAEEQLEASPPRTLLYTQKKKEVWTDKPMSSEI